MSDGISPLIQELTDFASLQDFVTENEGNLIELSKTYYCALGTDLGFETYAPYAFEQDEFCFELDIAWLSGSAIEVAFEFEFGNIEEMLAGLSKLLLADSELSVLVISSRAKAFSISTVVEIAKKLQKKPSSNLLIIDLANETYELI